MFLITAMIINSVISVYGAPQISVTESTSAQASFAGISEKSQQHQKYVPYIKQFNRKYKGYARKKGYNASLAKTYFVFADIDKDGTDAFCMHCTIRKIRM